MSVLLNKVSALEHDQFMQVLLYTASWLFSNTKPDLKSENIKFLHVNNMWDFVKKQIAFSEFAVLAVNWATLVTNNEVVSFYFQ